MIEPSEGGTEKILDLRLHTTHGPRKPSQRKTPTLHCSREAIDEFYDQLHRTIQAISRKEQLLLIGDHKSRVGADHDSWPTCLNHFRYHGATCDQNIAMNWFWLSHGPAPWIMMSPHENTRVLTATEITPWSATKSDFSEKRPTTQGTLEKKKKHPEKAKLLVEILYKFFRQDR